jgi:hypothetical protein
MTKKAGTDRLPIDTLDRTTSATSYRKDGKRGP